MKTLSYILGFMLLSLTTYAQEKDGINITITIDNVLNDNGKVLLSLHSSDTFMKGKGIKSLESTIIDGKINVTFKNVAQGEYAILVLHDENENNQMDFESNGMPKESYGMSGNIMTMGPPTFADAKFHVTNENITLNIRL
ncbi:MAG: DUF2141 domain-containing protein [Cellulophaga sp.]